MNYLTGYLPGYESAGRYFQSALVPQSVFDFDNTSAIFDVEEALLAYQIENLEFKIAPENLADVLETQIPSVDEPVGKNLTDSDVTVANLVADITSDYQWLHELHR